MPGKGTRVLTTTRFSNNSRRLFIVLSSVLNFHFATPPQTGPKIPALIARNTLRAAKVHDLT